MKKVIRLVLLAALMVPLGAKAQVSLPISTDFEDQTLGGWTLTHGHSSSGVSSSYAHESSYGFYFYYTTEPSQYLISPEFVPATGTEAVSFWYKNSSTSYPEEMAVGYSSTTNDTSAFTWGNSITVNSGEWTEFYEQLPAGTKYVAIKSMAYDAYFLCIDDIRIGEAPTCFRVQSITASNVTGNEMTVSWVDTLNTNATYTLTFWADGSTDTTVENIMSGNSYTFTDLDAATLYHFSIVPDCSDGSVAPRTGSATTDISCENGMCNITFNMTDSYGDGWNGNAINVYQGSALMGSATITTGANGTESIQVCSGIAVSLTFTSGNFAYEMGGTVTDGGGNTVFTIENMGNYSGGSTLATLANPCPNCLAPMSLDTVMNEDGDIVLTWVSSSTLFAVYDNGTLVADNVTDTFYAFTGLSAASTHTLGVAAACDGDEMSGISTLSITTPCGVITSMPWSTSFESDATTYVDPNCWTVPNHTESFGTYYPCVYGYTTHSGSRSIYFSTSYEEDTNLMASSPIAYNPSNLHIKYWIYPYLSDATFEAGIMTNPNDASTFVAVKTLTGSSPEYNSYVYTQYEFFTDELQFDEDDTVYLAFRLHGGYGYIYLDDIEMNSIPACRMPAAGSGSVTNIAYESADFAWSGNSENGYDLKLVRNVYNDTTGALSGTETIHVFADSTMITVDTLVANSVYSAYVATICEGDEGTDTTDYLFIGQFQTQMRCYPVSHTRLAAVTSSAAAITWNYLEDMGIAGTAAVLTLTDLTDTTVAPTTTTVENANSYTYTGLVSGHTYSVTLNSICGDEGDTATDRTVFFTTHAPSCTQYFTDDEATSTASAPIYSSTSYPYGYSQTLYEGGFLNDLDTLTGVSYNASFYNQNYEGINTYTVDIYLGVVDTSALTYYSGNYYLNSAIPVDSTMVRVVRDRTFSVTHTDWFYIPFDAAWQVPAIDSSKRLVVTVVSQTEGVDNNTNSWRAKYDYTYDANYNYYYKARYYNGNSSPFDPTESGFYTYGSSYVPNIQFHGNCSAGCVAPNASATSSTGNSITLNIFANGTESSWQVEYKLPEDTVWTVAGTATTSPYTINGLTSGTVYQIRVGANCTDTVVYCNTFTANTACEAIMPPYSVTFTSGANPCWSSNLSSPGSYGYNLYSTYYLISPEMGAPLDTLAVTITGRAYSSSSNTGLQLMACDADGSNAVPIDTVNLVYNNGNPMDYTIYVMNYTGTQNHFKLINANSGDVYVQAVSIDYLPACMPVSNVTMDSNSTTSISLSWTVNSPNAGFTVNYREEGSNSWSNMNVTTNNATITGLTASTRYEVQVITICTDSTTMATPTMLFTSECVPQGIPYTQTLFTSMPACWSVNTVGHPSTSWDASTAYGYGYIYSYASGSTTIANDWLMTTQIAIPATITADDSVMIVYQIAGVTDSYNTSSIAAYELLVDPTGGYNFTDTVTIDTVTSEVFSYRRFPAIQYAGDTIRIAFRSTCKSYGEIAMYDFGVRSILNPLYYIEGESSAFVGDANNFKAIRVEGETNGVSFTWSSAMAAAGQATMANATTDSITITYSASGVDTITMIATNVHGSDTSRAVVRVFDLAPVSMFPYTTDFEATATDNYSWITLNSVNAWTLGTAADDAANQSMMVSNDGTTNAYTGTTSAISWAYRALQIADTGDYTISFDWKCNGESNYDYLRVWLIPDSNFNIATDVIPGGLSSMYSLYNADIEGWTALGGKLNLQTDWTNQTDTVNINVPGRYFLAFMWGNDGSVMNQPPAAIDNVVISNGGVSCPMPEISSIVAGEDNLVINFTSEADSVEIVVNEGSFNPDATGVVVTGNTYTATGLTYSELYSIAIRSICGDGMVSEWTVRADSTLMVNCGVPTNLAATATDYNSISLSWTAAGEELAWEVSLYNTMDTVNVTSTTTSATVSGLVAGTAYNAVVRALCGQNSNIEGDWSVAITVSTDACEAVEGITVTPGSTTATVNWTATGNSYRVVWGELPFNPQDLSGEATVNTNSYVITGLDPETAYAVVIYNNCAEGLSMASNPVNFTTTAGGGDPTLYTVTVSANNDAWGSVTGSGQYVEGSTATISATANDGYRFVEWDDHNTDNPRTFTVTSNMSFTAIFESTGNGIEDVLAGTVSLYPNPASTSVTLGLEGFEGESQVEVVDMNGRVVIRHEVRDSKLEMNVSELPQGAYFVRVTNGTRTAISKLIVK